MIETDLYARQVEAHKTTSFSATLPPLQSELARQALPTPGELERLMQGGSPEFNS